jgi:hypothetical protein
LTEICPKFSPVLGVNPGGLHFDSFLGFPGYSHRLLPLHRYFVQAMDTLSG